ncbi:MAG: hypothetical protein ACW99U_06920 [Candidatus Thorarchaeota archaeon]|jgi:hypothetical protein
MEDRVFEQVNSKFLSFGDPKVWGWNEYEWYQVSLFDPMKPKDNEEWGAYGKIFVSKICLGVYDILKARKGANDGLILCSHSLLEDDQKRDFIKFLFQQKELKKVFFLEVDAIHTTGKITDERVEKEVAGVSHQKLNETEFIELVENGQTKMSTVYEILRKWH